MTIFSKRLFVFFLSVTAWSSGAHARELWEEPQDATVAINQPDLYAWQLFTALNWPADPTACAADPKKALGIPGKAVWETWRSKKDTYLEKAAKPKSWTDGCVAALNAPKTLSVSSQLTAVMALNPEKKLKKSGMQILFELPEGPFSTAEDEEVRLNKATYEFIRDNKLYSLTEQERLAAAGVQTLVFPLNSKEVKAHWVEIEEADKPRYHWDQVKTSDGKTKIYGLVGLHIITRDLPRWFWSTFEHVDNEKRWPAKYPEGFRGWVVPSRDSLACPEANLACNKIPSGFGLEGTKWANYRLRATQTDWVDHRGKPTVIANSKIEGSFDQNTMSCITCHALAVKGATGRSMPILIIPGTSNEEGLPHGYIGPLDQKLFLDANGKEVPYLGLDFIWSLRNAQREE
jgi:hypothetical protein